MVTVAIPSSIIGGHSCYNLEQATNSLYEVVRACVLFKVREIIVYDVPTETVSAEPAAPVGPKKILLDQEPVVEKTKSDPLSEEAVMAANLLQYLITPVHLRRQVFGSKNKKLYHYARKLPRIAGLQTTEDNIIEGIAIKKFTTRKKTKKSKKELADAKVTPYVNVGHSRVFKLVDQVPVHSRVLVNTKTKKAVKADPKISRAYAVRATPKFSHIFTHASVAEGYSHTVYVSSQQFHSKPHALISETGLEVVKGAAEPLLVFGKWQEIEAAVKADADLDTDAASLFDGSATDLASARTEDAIMISLALLSRQ